MTSDLIGEEKQSNMNMKWCVSVARVLQPRRVKSPRDLAGTVTKTRRMCSRVLSDSPVKLPAGDDTKGEVHGGCGHLDPPSVSPAKRKLVLDGLANLGTPRNPLSLLPASSLLQKGFDLITSQLQASPEKKISRPFTVSIEGNIGSGKSTFLQYFAALPGVDTHQEPIDLWTNVNGHNLLQKLYEDPERWSFLFQSYVQLTRLNIHLKNTSNPVKLIERSLQNNRYCFVESGHDSGHLKGAEYSVLCEYYDILESELDIDIDLIVYLRSTPETVYTRMLKRGRSEEAGLPLDYLKKLHDYYERWLLNHEPRAPPASVLVIDADQDLDDVKREYELKKSVIMGHKTLQS